MWVLANQVEPLGRLYWSSQRGWTYLQLASLYKDRADAELPQSGVGVFWFECEGNRLLGGRKASGHAGVKHIWACECRTETGVQPEQVKDGAVFECPGCKGIWGCVRGPWSYGSKWVPIAPELAEFHRLLPRHKPEDEE